MTEKVFQEHIQDVVQALAGFADADVVINDWSILDQSLANAPYVIIENSDDFTHRQDTPAAVDVIWNIPFILAVKLAADSWETALNAFRDNRQAILNTFVDGNRDPANGLTIEEVRADGPIGYIYPAYLPEAQQAFATPEFVSQRFIAVCKEF